MRPFDQPESIRILDFLRSIAIPFEFATLEHATFLPGIEVAYGTLRIDPDGLLWPGDLLHEAGHIAVTPPEERATRASIPSDPGEEMAAIAWSYAALVAIALPPEYVFHPGGYKGGGAAIAENFTAGRYFGVPLLQWYGMTTERGDPAYPRMTRWLR